MTRLLAPLCLSVAFVAAPAHACIDVHDAVSKAAGEHVEVTGPQSGKPAVIPLHRLRALVDTYDRLVAVAAIPAPKFVICADATVNAYAIAGGRRKQTKVVYLASSMVQRVFRDDRDLAAGIIAHELGHHVLEHLEQRKQAVDTAKRRAEAAQERARESGDANSASDALRGLVQDLFAFSREQEYEADRYGLIAMDRAGYNPEAFTRGMLAFRKFDRGGPTHPQLVARIARLEDVIADKAEGRQVALNARATAEASRPYAARAKGLHEAGRWDELERHVNVWLERIPEASMGWYYRALVIMRTETTPQGLSALEKAVSLDPATEPAWLELCLRSYELGLIRESANCARHLKSPEALARWNAATGERVIVGGAEPRQPSRIRISRDEDGRATITNDPSLTKDGGSRYSRVPPAWAPRP